MPEKEATEKTIKSFFRNFMANFWDGFLMATPNFVRQLFSSFEKELPIDKEIGWKSWCQNLVSRKIIDQDTADLLKPLVDEKPPLGFFMVMMTRFKILTTEIQNIINIVSLDRQYSHLAATTPNPAPVDNLIRSMIIDPKRTNENRAELKKYGFDDNQIDNIILSYYRTVDENTIRTCYLRGVITTETMYDRMHELGYTDTRIKEIVPTWEIIPGPQDLFTMVAKEAFEPDIYKVLGLDKEFPTEQVEWLKKQGISEDWAKKFWIAHWDQPSIGQGFEMLHRGVITLKELDLLFRAVEIPSFWRDKLTAIAYMPYTRVDTRRMHELGVLSDEELIKSYMDQGYDAAKALKMAQFTIAFNASHEKELTRGAILESYENGLITSKQAKDLLTDQGYSDALAEYYITLTDYNAEKDTQKLIFDNIRERYLLNVLNSVEVRAKLSKMNVSGSKIDAYIEKWNLQKYKYERLPSLTDLTDFFLREIITEAQFRSVMTQHGFGAAHINWYLEAIKSPEAASPRIPSRTDLEKFFMKGIIDETKWREQMKLLRYDEKYIEWYLKEMVS